MSVLSQFLNSGGGKLRYQEFLTSGTFTPPADLVAAGGQCWAMLVGGGGGGGAGGSGVVGSSNRVGYLFSQIGSVFADC